MECTALGVSLFDQKVGYGPVACSCVTHPSSLGAYSVNNVHSLADVKGSVSRLWLLQFQLLNLRQRLCSLYYIGLVLDFIDLTCLLSEQLFLYLCKV